MDGESTNTLRKTNQIMKKEIFIITYIYSFIYYYKVLHLVFFVTGYMKLCISGLALMGTAYVIHFLNPVQMAKEFVSSFSDILMWLQLYI